LIGALLLIILLLAVLLRRNRSESDDFQAEDDEDELNTSSDMPVYTSQSAAAVDYAVTEIGIDDKQFEGVSAQASAIIEGAQADDLLDEVDTMLACDQISAARVLLQKAIAAEPERSDLRLKLLDVCAADGDAEGFNDEEASLPDDQQSEADADADDFDRNDLRFLSDSDEAATKLDLARAYIDMGDNEGAREILQEVLKEGTAVQIDDARSLLERIL
jgi:pilus assembly protein FimV